MPETTLVSTSPPYMLDTNICIYVMKHHPPQVKKRLSQCSIGEVSISSIVLAELWHGIHKSQQRENNTSALNDFLQFCTVEAWPESAADTYGKIRSQLEQKGKVIGGNDLLIAAHAQIRGAILVSNNLQEFQRVACLRVENWL